MASIADALIDRVPGLRASDSEIDRVSYSRDLWPRHHLGVRHGVLPSTRPAAVVWPRTVEEVAQVVARCADEGLPIAPFGAGSGVCGGTLPDARTVVLDLKRLSRVRSLSSEPRWIEVEAGAMGIRLEEDLAAQGHTLGHFPSSILCSTVGGWVAARSAGQCSGLYGKIEDMVVGLECVVGRGEIVRLSRRTQGPDVTPLMIGSEGILGVITAASLRLHPAPAERVCAAYSFPQVEAGWEAMRELFQAGLRPAVARLYDAFDSFMAKRGSVKKPKRPDEKRATGPRDLALRTLLASPQLLNGAVDAIGDKAFGGATLILVFEGEREHGMADAARARAIAVRHRATDLGARPARHWLAHRYAVSYRQAPVFMAGAFSDTMELAAPWSRLFDLYHGVKRAMSRHVFVMAHLSHAYPDGCSIYFTFAGSARGREQAEALYDATWAAAMSAVLANGGTLSHHHGVGRSKAPRLGDELGLGVEVVRQLAGELDPASVFNPGNLLPSASPKRSAAPVVPLDAPIVDDASLLMHAHGDALVSRLEGLARERGATLRFADAGPHETLASYLARGAPGAPDPYLDPVDHLVAGFSAKLTSGDDLVVSPGPRRAVGPDLFALFLGTGERAGRITSAHLRLHRQAASARQLTTTIERNPSLPQAEAQLIERMLSAAGRARFAL